MLAVRHAIVDDIPAMVGLLTILFTHEHEHAPGEERQRRGLEMLLTRPDLATPFVLTRDGAVIGMTSILWSVSTVMGGLSGTIDDVVVHPNHRGIGGAKTLLAHAIEFARQRGCLRLVLHTDDDNAVAQGLYHEFGFTRSTMITMRQKL